MAKLPSNVFSGGGLPGYFESKFLNDIGRNIELPSFEFVNALFHPYLKDHLIILSKTSFPKGKRWERMVP